MPKRIELWSNGQLIDTLIYRPEYPRNMVARLNETARAISSPIRAIWA